jgi:hypothetical protein
MHPVVKAINIILIVLALIILVLFIVNGILNGFPDLPRGSSWGGTKRGSIFDSTDFR